MSKTCVMCGITYPDASTFCPQDGSALRATVVGDDLIGELFCERYVVTDMLGEGGMATVYLARDVRLPQQVAIKVLRDTGTGDPSVVQRFRQEAEAASRINHDRVARVSDFGFRPDGRAFLVMEFVNGRTLRQLLDARGMLSFAEVARIVGMIAEGLQAAHRLGIVHRDLKPENVMVVEDDDGSIRVKVLDFGIAKLLEDQEGENRTAPGFVIGSPKWMSPEQLLGSPLDARSDVYTLALMSFAMLTGERAFSGISEQEEMMARLSVAPRTLADVRPDIAWPDGLEQLFRRTLVGSPAARPESALAFARELRLVLDRPASVSTPTTRRGQSAALAVTREAMVLTPSADPVLTPSAEAPATPARTPDPIVASRRVPRIIAIVSIVAVGAAAILLSQRPGGLLGRGADAVVPADTPSAAGTTPPPRTPSVTPPAVTDSTRFGVQTTPTDSSDSTDVDTLAPPAAAPGSVSRGTSPVTPSTTPRVAAPAAGAAKFDASAALEQLISDAEASIGTMDDETMRAKAADLIRRFDALTPRLRTDDDRGWAAFYIGTLRVTLGQTASACTSLRQARALATTSRALRSNSEKFLLDLNCNR